MISYEIKKKKINTTDDKNKEYLINEFGTKLANLICYLKSSDKHTILFSQWDSLLKKVGQVMSHNGIRNVFCRGNVYQRDKAIREFNQDDKIKVIMLSSESAASGTNLTKASQVILLDPVYGSYEYRKNTEWQAVGRAHRLGQQHHVKVIRFIIKDTVEEEIYKMNKEEDINLQKEDNIKILELTDDNITLKKSEDNISEDNNSEDNNDDTSKKVISIKKKNITKKVNKKKVDTDEESIDI
jgi:SNF2 family DNA or RNA helicase